VDQELLRDIQVIYYGVAITGTIVGIAVGLKTLGPEWRAKSAMTIITLSPAVTMFVGVLVGSIFNNVLIATIILYVAIILQVTVFWLMKGPVSRSEIVYLVLGCSWFSLTIVFVVLFHYVDRIIGILEKMAGHH
jgi:hypothetical protein